MKMPNVNRDEAVKIALQWKGTPYVTGGRVCGAGCDCATLISEYLIGIGAALEIPLNNYAQDWFCHTSEERYFEELSKYAKCVWEGRCMGTPPARPGDIALFRANLSSGPSPRYNHGCIVLGWPLSLQAFSKLGVVKCRPAMHSLTSGSEMAIFSCWPDHPLRGGEAVAAELFRFAVGLERVEGGF